MMTQNTTQLETEHAKYVTGKEAEIEELNNKMKEIEKFVCHLFHIFTDMVKFDTMKHD